MTIEQFPSMKSEIVKDQCPGMVFRCIHSQYAYLDQRGRVIWGDRTVMRQLKKESCEGCSNCGYLYDSLSEFVGESPTDIRPEIEHGAKYRLTVVDIHKDWETGIVDDWNLAFIKIEE